MSMAAGPPAYPAVREQHSYAEGTAKVRYGE